MMWNDKRGIPYKYLINIYEKSAGQRDVILKEVKNSYPEVYIGIDLIAFTILLKGLFLQLFLLFSMEKLQ